MKIATVLFVVGALAVHPTAYAQAAEQAFECPRISPVDGQTPLAFAKVW